VTEEEDGATHDQDERLVGRGEEGLMSHRTRWETPRARYDENSSKFFLGMKPKFNRPVGERNYF
jgi:hypothetical protein